MKNTFRDEFAHKSSLSEHRISTSDFIFFKSTKNISTIKSALLKQTINLIEYYLHSTFHTKRWYGFGYGYLCSTLHLTAQQLRAFLPQECRRK
jgi:hypothetical protein